MAGRGAAAAADEFRAQVHEPDRLLGKGFWPQTEGSVALGVQFGQARVGLGKAGHTEARRPGGQRVAHLLGPGRAVGADKFHSHVLHGVHKGQRRGAGQAGRALKGHGHGHGQGNRPAGRPPPRPWPRPDRSGSRPGSGRPRRPRSPGSAPLNISTNSRKVRSPNGSTKWPVGPMDAATKARSPATCRAMRVMARFSSYGSASSPSLGLEPPKVLVVRMSAPASRYSWWTPRMTSGSLSPHSSGDSPGGQPPALKQGAVTAVEIIYPVITQDGSEIGHAYLPGMLTGVRPWAIIAPVRWLAAQAHPVFREGRRPRIYISRYLNIHADQPGIKTFPTSGDSRKPCASMAPPGSEVSKIIEKDKQKTILFLFSTSYISIEPGMKRPPHKA